MGYALNLVRNAVRTLRALPVEVQEAALDVLEALAAGAEPAAGGLGEGYEEYHVLLYRDDARVFKVLMAVNPNHATRTLTVLAIWYVARIGNGPTRTDERSEVRAVPGPQRGDAMSVAPVPPLTVLKPADFASD